MKIALIIESLLLAVILLRWIIQQADRALRHWEQRQKRIERELQRRADHNAHREEYTADLLRQCNSFNPEEFLPAVTYQPKRSAGMEGRR